MVRNLTTDDVLPVINLLLKFHQESHQRILTMDTDKLVDMLYNYINTAEAFFKVYDCGGKIKGFFSGTWDSLYSVEKLGFLSFFYIDPCYRNGKVSLSLVKELALLQDEKDIKIMYATSTAGMGKVNQNSFTRLFKRVGFIDDYGCLTRIKK